MSFGRPDPQRLADALRSAGVDARPRPDCPPAEQIWDALHLEMPAADRARIIDHTIECPSCAEAWRLAIAIEGKDATVAGAPPAPRAWFLQPAAWARVAAAGLVIAVGTAVVLRWGGPSEKPGLRDQPPDAIRPLVPEDTALPRQDFTLRWSSGPDGARYDLVVTTVDLEVIADVRELDRPDGPRGPGAAGAAHGRHAAVVARRGAHA